MNCTNRKPLVELAKINPGDVPFIVAVEPAEGTSWIPTNTQLSVLFSHPMDRDSIEDALEIYYEGFKLDGSSMTFEWDSYSIQCKINPQLIFPLNAEITVTIDNSTRSKDGIPMKKPFTWSFVISAKKQTGEPIATPLCPSINYEILALNKSIEIGFDRQMLRSSVEGSISASGESVGVYVNNGMITIQDNVLITGGNTHSGDTYGNGIYLAYNALDINCIIFNNIFNTYNFNQDLDRLAGTKQGSANTIDALNGDFGKLLFNPDPDRNLEETDSPATIFNYYSNNDYHIKLTISRAKNNGCNDEEYNLIYSEEGAIYDIDGAPRPEEYNLIDLGADEFGD